MTCILPLILAALLAAPSASVAVAAPNVVLIVTDDQRGDTVGPMHGLGGPAMAHVQSLLADHGVTFTDAFVSSPICAASRASLLTGLYVHNHGVLNNHYPLGGVTKFDDSSTLATWLHDADYRTGLVGKYMNDYNLISPYIPPGWDDWHAFVQPQYYDYQINDNGTLHSRGHADSDYSTDVLSHKAITFIADSVAAEKPFFLYFAPYAPHLPATPANRHIGAFSSLPLWRPLSFNELDVSDKPQWIQDLSRFTQSYKDTLAAGIEAQMEAGLAVDEAVEAIVGELDDQGVLDDTLIVFIAGDNGFNWGEHRLAGKGAPHDEATRTTVIVRYAPFTTGTVDGSMVATVDISATIADLANADAPTTNGVSLKALIEGTGGGSRSHSLIEYKHDPDKPHGRSNAPTFEAVTNEQYLYIDYDDPAQGVELYDRGDDADQLMNQAGNPAYSDIKAGLAAELADLESQ